MLTGVDTYTDCTHTNISQDSLLNPHEHLQVMNDFVSGNVGSTQGCHIKKIMLFLEYTSTINVLFIQYYITSNDHSFGCSIIYAETIDNTTCILFIMR